MGKNGRPRLRIEDDVWKKMKPSEKRQYRWNNNIRFRLPPGEKSEQPTNPGNPNHPDYNPSSMASMVRRSHASKPNPEAIKSAIKEVLATRNQNIAPHKKRSRRSQAVNAGAPPASPASQANVTDTETLASTSRAHEEDLISFDSSDTEATASNGVGSEAAQALSANSEQAEDLISLDDTETEDTPRNVQTRPNLSQEIHEQLSQLDL